MMYIEYKKIIICIQCSNLQINTFLKINYRSEEELFLLFVALLLIKDHCDEFHIALIYLIYTMTYGRCALFIYYTTDHFIFDKIMVSNNLINSICFLYVENRVVIFLLSK